MKQRNKAALIFLAIFALPWTAISVAALVEAMIALLGGDLKNAMFEFIGFVVSGGVGFGLLAAVIVRWSPQTKADQLRAANPDKPWLWRADWAAGRADDSSGSTMWLLWLFAICWNAVTIPLGLAVLFAIITQQKFRAIPALLFPLVGMFWIWLARRAGIRRRKFGRSVFIIDPFPGQIGGVLAGRIEFQKTFSSEVEFELELSCLRRQMNRSGNNRTSMHDSALWRTSKTSRLDASGILPIEFLIPTDSHPTDQRKQNNQIVWQLHAHAPLPGISYEAWFEVPVFKNTHP